MKCEVVDDGDDKVCGGELHFVEKEISTTIEGKDGDKLAERGRTTVTYKNSMRVWLCVRCGRESTPLED